MGGSLAWAQQFVIEGLQVTGGTNAAAAAGAGSDSLWFARSNSGSNSGSSSPRHPASV